MLEIHDDGGVRELRFARPPVNALDPAQVLRLDAELRRAIEGGAGAIVLSGQPGLFSAGLDVPALLKLDRAGIREFFTAFCQVQLTVAKSPVPVIAAITGHAPAGGTVLVLPADYRIMAAGPFRIGLNEVEVGLIPGPVIRAAYARLIGEHRAAALLTRGAMVDPATAREYGLVDEVLDAGGVIARAHAYAKELLALPAQAMRRTRQDARASLVEIFERGHEPLIHAMVDLWHSDETQSRLAQLFVRRSQ